MSTLQSTRPRARYPSDMCKYGREKLKGLLPPTKSGPEKNAAVVLKEVINAIFYVLKNGCTWQKVPNDFLHWGTAYGYFNA